MRLFKLVILLLPGLLPACAWAQNLSRDVLAGLAEQWNYVDLDQNGNLHCLKALDFFTAKQPDPAAALIELTQGAQPRQAQYYPSAGTQGTLANLLATASTIFPGPAAVDGLFAQAATALANTYSQKDGVDNLYKNVYKEPDQARALFALLSIAQKPIVDYGKDPTIPMGRKKAVDAAKVMEVYRTCYRIDRARLFSLIRQFFN
jgi:hypothetical protein